MRAVYRRSRVVGEAVEVRADGVVCRELDRPMPGVFLVPWHRVSDAFLHQLGRAGMLSVREKAA